MSPAAHTRVFEEEELVDLTKLPDRVAETFKGKTVFVTGATGYVGRALVERILHNTEVKKVYVLIKSKRGENTHVRFAKYFDGIFFESLKNDRPESLKKVQPIQGDLSELDLGISREDRRKLIDEVDIIYHSGASVRFDEYIKRMILLNVRGTRNMVALAKEAKHLELFVHVSTTYCQPRNVVLEEGLSLSPHNPHDMIRIAENLDDATLNILSSKFVGAYGNTYSYSKALAEAIIFEQKNKLPITVVRPSIIIPCIRDPVPGFTDSEYGPLGSWILYFKGLVHVTNVPLNYEMDYVTLDMVINIVLITTYHNINNTENKVLVCNATNLKWSHKYLQHFGNPVYKKYPFNVGLGFPWIISVMCPFLYFIIYFFSQLLPAVIIDSALTLGGVNMKQNIVDVQRKIIKINLVLRFYTHWNSWDFKNNTIKTLRMDLNEREDDAYPTCADNLDVDEYAKNGLLMLRMQVLHEKLEDMPRARTMFQRFQIAHNVMKAFFSILFLRLAYTTILPLSIRFVYYIFDV